MSHGGRILKDSKIWIAIPLFLTRSSQQKCNARRRNPSFHQKSNGTLPTRFSKILLELLDTQVFLGSVKRGSDRWLFFFWGGDLPLGASQTTGFNDSKVYQALIGREGQR